MFSLVAVRAAANHVAGDMRFTMVSFFHSRLLANIFPMGVFRIMPICLDISAQRIS